MHLADEMIRYFGQLLSGKFDHEQTYYFTVEFIKDLMSKENKYDLMKSLVDKEGYLIGDVKKGDFDKERNAYCMTIYYMKLETITT